jgi:hypothetical protein
MSSRSVPAHAASAAVPAKVGAFGAALALLLAAAATSPVGTAVADLLLPAVCAAPEAKKPRVQVLAEDAEKF